MQIHSRIGSDAEFLNSRLAGARSAPVDERAAARRGVCRRFARWGTHCRNREIRGGLVLRRVIDVQ